MLLSLFKENNILHYVVNVNLSGIKMEEEESLEGWKDGDKLYSPKLPVVKSYIDNNDLEEFIKCLSGNKSFFIEGMSALKYAIKEGKIEFACEMVKLGFTLDKSEVDVKKAKDILIANKNIFSRMRGDSSLTKNDMLRMVVVSNIQKSEYKDKWLASKASPLKIAIETKQFDLAKKIIESGGVLKSSELKEYGKENIDKRSFMDKVLGRGTREISCSLVKALENRDPQVRAKRVIKEGELYLYQIDKIDLLDNLVSPEKIAALNYEDLSVLYKLTVQTAYFNALDSNNDRSVDNLNKKIIKADKEGVKIKTEEMLEDMKIILDDCKEYMERSQEMPFDLSYIKQIKSAMVDGFLIHYNDEVKLLKEKNEEVIEIGNKIKASSDSLLLKQIAYDVTKKGFDKESFTEDKYALLEEEILKQLKSKEKIIANYKTGEEIEKFKDDLIEQIREGNITNAVKKVMPPEMDPLGVDVVKEKEIIKITSLKKSQARSA